MEERKIRLGIVGCGHIFKKHLQAIVDNANLFEIVGVANHNKEIVLEFPKEWKVQTFYDHKEMFSKLGDKLDLVVILTQSTYHYDIAKETLESGYDVLIEKPVAIDISKIKEINDLATKLGRKAHSVLQCRYMSVFSSLKSILKENLIGDIRCIDFAQMWQRPIGHINKMKPPPLYEYSIHYLDIIQILFGIPKVLFTKTFTHKHIDAPYEDTIRSVVEYDGGISGSIRVTLAFEPSSWGTKLLIMGSKGYLDVDFVNSKVDASFEDKEDKEKYDKLMSTVVEDNCFGQLYKEIYGKNAITVLDSIQVVQFIQNIYGKI